MKGCNRQNCWLMDNPIQFVQLSNLKSWKISFWGATQFWNKLFLGNYITQETIRMCNFFQEGLNNLQQALLNQGTPPLTNGRGLARRELVKTFYTRTFSSSMTIWQKIFFEAQQFWSKKDVILYIYKCIHRFDRGLRGIIWQWFWRGKHVNSLSWSNKLIMSNIAIKPILAFCWAETRKYTISDCELFTWWSLVLTLNSRGE